MFPLKNKLFYRFLTFILAFFLPSVAFASLADSLNDYFNEVGSANVTEPGYYKGQTRGYLSGGNLIMKFPRKSFTPFTLTPPGIKGGCGGIKLYGGAFSFANLEEFKQYAQQVIQNAAGLIFELALQNLTPQVASVWRSIRDLLENKLKYLNDSCYAAQQLVNAAKVENVFEAIADTLPWNREKEERKEGNASDEFEVKRRVQEKEDDTPPRRQKISINVAWSALNKVNIPSPLTKEIVMSLTGTTVVDYRSGFDHPTFNFYPPLIDYEKMMEGWSAGEKTLYYCSDQKCLEVGTESSSGFVGMKTLVLNTLTDITVKIENGAELTEEERKFIGFVSTTPIYNYLIKASRFEGGMMQAVIQSSDMVASVIVLDYSGQIYQAARAARADLPDEDNLPQEYQRLLDSLSQRLSDARDKHYKMVQNSLSQLQTTLTLLEVQERSTPLSLKRNLAFGKMIQDSIGIRE